jgi:hypothetical protein
MTRTAKYFLSLVVLIVIFFVFFISSQRDAAALSKLKEDCFKIKNDYQKLICLKPYFEKFTIKYGPTKATEEAVAIKKQGIGATCHIVSHPIGSGNLKRNNYNLEKSFASCPFSTVCQGGCVHGVVEEYATERLDTKNIQAMVNICNKLKDRSTWESRQCFHGLGHGLIKKGVKTIAAYDFCKIHGKTDRDFFGCIGGVAMERVNNYMKLPEDELLKKTPEICKEEIATDDQIISQVCLGRLIGDLAYYASNDHEKIKKFCSKLPIEEAICFDVAATEIKQNMAENIDVHSREH